jgi:molybdopterin molybdotransferase
MLGITAGTDEEPAILSVNLPENGPRTHYLRASLSENSTGLPSVVPLAQQDSSLLGVLARADCLLIHPAKAERSEVGSICSIIRF